MGNTDFGPGDEWTVAENHDERHREAMLSVSFARSLPPRTIGDALANPRVFALTFFEDDPEFGPTYNAEASALVKKSESGSLRGAEERLQHLTRPQERFAPIDVAGLITCIGIVMKGA